MDERFTIFETQAQVLNELPDEDAGKLFKALAAAAFDWDAVELEGTLRLLCMAMRPGVEKSASLSKTRADARVGKGKKQTKKQTEKQTEKQTKKETLLEEVEVEVEVEVDKKEEPNPLSGKPDDAPPFSEIVGYLNERTGKQYRADSGKAKRAISARWREGYTLADFHRVVDNQLAAWGGDERMTAYLRPETLFGAKFDGYLNNSPPEKSLVNAAYTADPSAQGWGDFIDDEGVAA